MWPELFAEFSSLFTLKTILTSLFASLAPVPCLEASPIHRNQVKSEALLLTRLVGNLMQDRQEIWDASLSVMISRDWNEGYGRIFVCWLANSKNNEGAPPETLCTSSADMHQVLQAFLEVVMALWVSPEHIRHSLLARHQCKYFAVLIM